MSKMWQPIESAPESVWNFEPVDLWVSVSATPSSFGMSDAWRVPDCWRKGGVGAWCHYHNGVETELRQGIITHWMRPPTGPNAHNARLSDNESGTPATDDAKETGKTTGDNT